MEKNDVRKYTVIAIGGSAGSLETLLKIIGSLEEFDVVMIIIVHRNNTTTSFLKDLISSKTKRPVKEVEDKENIENRGIYIAPAGYHLLLEDENTFSLDVSEKINFSRPSIDVTFESAAQIFQSKLIGLLLSGASADGSQGLQKISDHGGYTIVQQPETAEIDYMPKHAINTVKVDAVIAGNTIGNFIKTLL